MQRRADIVSGATSPDGIEPPSRPGPGRYGPWAGPLSILSLPVYVWQGVGMRRRSVRLSPPPGPIEGRFPGDAPEICLLVLGDSSVQAVGANRQEEGLAYNMAESLARLSGRAVRWRAAGFNSATVPQLTRVVLPHLEPRDFTHIVLSAGVNDAKNWHGARRFKRDFGEMIYALRARFTGAQLFWNPIFDFRLVPALPQPLATVLDMRADLLTRKARHLCRERGMSVLPEITNVQSSGFSRDGFHAGPLGYQLMGTQMAKHILRAENATDDPGAAN
ncbi:SGNH/GDSL hydrolase family protein [Notoacmeibacter ruber]|uniref:SGNH/GDSL hydrolase family protein n=1 Tax=Notoacmeibacter ruber TaxID=2670375 RepID=A0A3L7JD65_9HYPH|nr:SGNH/GDSL hydrolase family protein [Notoacmeibacter ruber]RLQ88728.1 SGNH/GDSL hydrolase family protein [Notoacmeibacter ruber]